MNFYDFLIETPIHVYPVVYGVYQWENEKDSSILYEYANGQKYVRCGYRGDTLLDDSILNQYGKYVKPKECQKETIVNALKKMDQETMNGSCLIKANGHIIQIPSLHYSLASQQFHMWLREIVQECNTFEQVHDIIELPNDDLESRYFSCRSFFYLIQEMKYYDDDDLLQCLRNLLDLKIS